MRCHIAIAATFFAVACGSEPPPTTTTPSDAVTGSWASECRGAFASVSNQWTFTSGRAALTERIFGDETCQSPRYSDTTTYSYEVRGETVEATDDSGIKHGDARRLRLVTVGVTRVYATAEAASEANANRELHISDWVAGSPRTLTGLRIQYSRDSFREFPAAGAIEDKIVLATPGKLRLGQGTHLDADPTSQLARVAP